MNVKFYLNLKMPQYLCKGYTVPVDGKLALYDAPVAGSEPVFYFSGTPAGIYGPRPLSDDNPALFFASREIAVSHAAGAGIFVDSRNNVYDRCKLTR